MLFLSTFWKEQNQNKNPTKTGAIKDDDTYKNYDDNSDEYEDDHDVENDEFIDQMLEKPIDILEEKDQCNFYTYDKIQIKSTLCEFYLKKENRWI